MAKDTRQVLAEELGRILADFRRVETEMERLGDERKRLAAIAQRLLQILRKLAPRAADRLIEDLGLAEAIALLPGVPGRKPTRGGGRKVRGAKSAKAPPAGKGGGAAGPARKAGRPTTAPKPLPKGVAVRMLAGKYKGWTGLVRWITAKGSAVSYTLDLVGPGGRRARNQVGHGRLGSTWELTTNGPPEAAAAHAEGKKRGTSARRGAGRKQPGSASLKKPAAPRARTRTVVEASEVLAKGTEVRLLKGRYKGRTGVIGWTSRKGSTVTYTVYLPGAGGAKNRTQIGRGSQGKSWEVVGAADAKALVAAVATPAATDRKPAAKTVRRRRASTPAVQAAEPASDSAAIPAPPPATAPQGILPKGTAVKMITGIYLGYTGVVASVQARPGPRPDAIYTLVLRGPGGKKGRTSVKQGTLGRTWTKVG